MPPPSTSASLLYQSLANAVDTVRGTVVLDLNAANWLTNLFGQDILWIVPDLCEAEVQFSYAAGFLNSASITFDPPVQVDVRGNLGGALLSAITYNRFGTVIAVTMVPTTEVPMSDATKTAVLRTVAFDRAPASLFLGVPFAGLLSAQPVDAHYQHIAGPQAVISRVRFTPDAGVPALAVSFRDQALIKFSDSTVGGSRFSNFLTVRSGTGFEFDEIDYFVDERSLSGSLRSLTAIVERGLFSTSNFQLQLQAGGSVNFDHVNFSKDAAGAVSVNATFGAFQASVTAGSNVTLATDAVDGTTFLSLDDGSNVSVVGFAVSIDDAGATAIQVGGGSSVQLNIDSGRIGLGAGSFLSLPSGHVDGTFDGTWSSIANPIGRLKISRLNFSGVTGELYFNEKTRLAFQDAAISSNSLAFDSAAPAPKLTGTFLQFQFTIADSSSIAIPSGFVILPATGGIFRIATPLVLQNGSAFPIGQYTLNLPFKRMLNAQNASFSLNSGQVSLSLQSRADGTILGNNCDFQGQAVIVAGNLSVAPTVHISALSFTKPIVGDFTANGSIQVAVPAGVQLPITTPFIKGVPDHDDLRAFPLTLNASLSQPFLIPATAFSILNDIVTLAPINATPSVNVTIPNGLGEHEDSDDPNSADGQHGPDEDKNLQEAVTDKISLARVHLYLQSATYGFSAQISVAINTNQLDVNISQVQSDRDIGFNRDGGDLGPIGAIIGFAFGGVIPAIIGYVAGEDLNQSVNHLIAGALARYLLNLRFSWHAQL